MTWSLTFTAQQFQKHNAAPYYPGDDYVDVIAADGYNWYGCAFHQGPWRSFGQVFSAFYEFGQLHAKPMVMAEYGTGEDVNVVGRKGQWFTDAADQVKRWPLIKGVAYFNVGGGTCARYVDTSPTSLQAFQAMGADPYFNPPVPTTTVTAADFSFTPSTVSVSQGSGVIWNNAGPSNHQPQDTTGMTLFDSGPLAPGASYTFIFISAGNYAYQCAIHPNMTGTVKVPATASPPTGTITTTFTITWAADNAPTDYTFDVQIKRPGQVWRNWLMGQNVGSGTFVPDVGTGTYSFRARYHQTALSKASAYSDPVSIVVN